LLWLNFGARQCTIFGHTAQIEKLEPAAKRQVLQLIDAFVERCALKGNARGKAAA
jgi:hypothetical protein